MNTVSEDGYVRIAFSTQLDLSLTHLISGIDEIPYSVGKTLDTQCEITGYTEWISSSETPITIGWDWQLTVSEQQIVYQRFDSPRSNLMFIDSQKRDLGYVESTKLLEELIDNLDWQPITAHEISLRY